MSNLNDSYWIEVSKFAQKHFSHIEDVFGPLALREMGLPLQCLDELEYREDPPSGVILHKGELDIYSPEVIDKIYRTMTPVFANEVFVAFSLDKSEQNIVNSVHYKAFLEKLKILGRSMNVSASHHPHRMAVYLGNNRALTKTIYGHKMYVDTRDRSLTPHILLDGYWEKWITNVFLHLVKPGMSVVEVGANVGFYSLLAAQHIGDAGRLVCFEANNELCDIVFENLMINGFLSRSSVVNKAVYSENTTLTFNIYEKHLGSSSLWAEKEHGVHPNQISQWKQQAKEQIAAGFAGKSQKAQQNDEARIKELHEGHTRRA